MSSLHVQVSSLRRCCKTSNCRQEDKGQCSEGGLLSQLVQLICANLDWKVGSPSSWHDLHTPLLPSPSEPSFLIFYLPKPLWLSTFTMEACFQISNIKNHTTNQPTLLLPPIVNYSSPFSTSHLSARWNTVHIEAEIKTVEMKLEDEDRWTNPHFYSRLLDLITKKWC